MTWYTTGTISVTNGSATVTGSGTAFVANVQPGFGLQLNGGGLVYEVVAVVSDTQLTIAPAYVATSQSGQAYRIIPTRSFAGDLVASVNALIASVNGYLTTALAGRFADGTDSEPGISFAGDTNTGFRRPAADRIAAITNGVQRWLLTTTALQVNVPVTGTAVQSGAADATAGRLLKVGAEGAALGADVYRRGNLLGTVSQSGGTPTGAAMQRGSNANGQFVRFADGTQICTAQLVLNYVGTFGCTRDWTYPAAFIGTGATDIAVSFTVEESAGGFTPSIGELTAGDTNTLGTATGQIRVRRISGTTDFAPGDTVTVRVTAVGRWF